MHIKCPEPSQGYFYQRRVLPTPPRLKFIRRVHEKKNSKFLFSREKNASFSPNCVVLSLSLMGEIIFSFPKPLLPVFFLHRLRIVYDFHLKTRNVFILLNNCAVSSIVELKREERTRRRRKKSLRTQIIKLRVNHPTIVLTKIVLGFTLDIFQTFSFKHFFTFSSLSSAPPSKDFFSHERPHSI